MMIWREKLFAFMYRNALRATSFYSIPPEKVVELGLQLEIRGGPPGGNLSNYNNTLQFLQ